MTKQRSFASLTEEEINQVAEWLQHGTSSLLKNCGNSVCERGGCKDEARRLSISVAICDGGATTSVHSPRRKMRCWNFSTDSYDEVRDRIAKPRPEGFGIKVSRSPPPSVPLAASGLEEAPQSALGSQPASMSDFPDSSADSTSQSWKSEN